MNLSRHIYDLLEDSLEEEMATHSSILAWKIPWTEEPGRLQSMGSQELNMTEHTHYIYHTINKNKDEVIFGENVIFISYS